MIGVLAPGGGRRVWSFTGGCARSLVAGTGSTPSGKFNFFCVYMYIHGVVEDVSNGVLGSCQ